MTNQNHATPEDALRKNLLIYKLNQLTQNSFITKEILSFISAELKKAIPTFMKTPKHIKRSEMVDGYNLCISVISSELKKRGLLK